MNEPIVALNSFNRHYLHRMIDSIADPELDSTFGPGSHSARWILVHLAIAVDYGFKQLDMPFVAPKEWHVAYGPGSDPASNAKLRPTKAELLKFIDDNYIKLCIVSLDADSSKLSVAHTVPLLYDTPVKTKGDLLAHILTTHFATHVGQLSSWRRLLGLPPLF
jgi:uncharacterized damage-inducible protein DinB